MANYDDVNILYIRDAIQEHGLLGEGLTHSHHKLKFINLNTLILEPLCCILLLIVLRVQALLPLQQHLSLNVGLILQVDEPHNVGLIFWCYLSTRHLLPLRILPSNDIDLTKFNVGHYII